MAMCAGPTWSSTGSESTAAAAQEACRQLRERLQPFLASEATAEASWTASIVAAHPGVGFMPASALLSAYGYYDGKERPAGSGVGASACSRRNQHLGSQGLGCAEHALQLQACSYQLVRPYVGPVSWARSGQPICISV